MQYEYFKAKLDKDPKGLSKELEGCKRNEVISLYEEYYRGNQWKLEGNQGETRFSRSGKEQWKMFDDQPHRGFTSGELKKWNLVKLAINIFTKYVRGQEKEDVQVIIKKNGKQDKDLTKEANKIFGDLNDFVTEATKIMSIKSVVPTKYNFLANKETTENEVAILQSISLDPLNDIQGLVELIDPKEIEPIYWKGYIRGFLRFFYTTEEEVSADYGMTVKAKNPLYFEAWYIDDAGKLSLKKYIEGELVEEVKNIQYKNLPYTLAVNEKNVSADFDLYNLEESDVADNLDVQDDLNAFLTDLNLLYRRVAIPMLKASDEYMKNAKGANIQKFKEEMGKINTALGSILFAPIEAVDSPSTNGEQPTFLDSIIDQFYRQTGIPKSVINSEGIANVARETLDHLFQSLNVVIGHKRTQLNKIITYNTRLHLIQTGKWDDKLEIEIYYPDIFPISKTDTARMILEGKKEGIVSKTYAIEKYAQALGDGDEAEGMVDELLEEDASFKLDMESKVANALAKKDTETNTNKSVNTEIDDEEEDENLD